MAPTEPASGTLINDRYEPIERIGSGGMGTVWLAEDHVLNRRIALKEIGFPPGLDDADRDTLRRRVLREARAAAQLSHHGAVVVFDVLDTADKAYIAMELVSAPTLAELVERDGPLSVDETARLGREIVTTLKAAHDRGVVHRDVKPGNVMASETGVKLADFGIAAIAGDPRLTASGLIVGSPAFMAPEQAHGHAGGPATDVWGLGVTLYFALTGESPFERGSQIATMAAVDGDEPPADPRLGRLATVVARMLSKDPHSRPSLEEIEKRLEGTAPAGNGTRVQTRAAPAAAPVAAPRRSRRTGGWVVTGVVAAAALLAAFALWPGDEGGGKGERGGKKDRAEAAVQPVPEGWDTYAISDSGYEVAFPADWATVDDALGDGSSVRFEDGDGRYLLMDWTTEPGDDATADWAAQSDGFGASHEDYVEIGIEPVEFMDFPTAALWEYTYSDGGAALHAYNLGFADDEYGFALNFQTHEEDWSSSADLWAGFQDGFRRV